MVAEWNLNGVSDLHWFSLQRGSPKSWVEMESSEIEKRFLTDHPNHVGFLAGNNYRRFGIYTINVPDWAGDNLETDLAPYNNLGDGFKKRLMFSLPLTHLFGKLKSAKVLKKREWLPIPTWRMYVIVVILGYTNFEKGGVKMRKYMVAMECKRIYSTQLLEWLEARRYTTSLPNMPGIEFSPEVNELRLFDITTQISCEGQLLRDLQPYQAIDDVLPLPLKLLVKAFRFVFKLKPPPKTCINLPKKYPKWRESLNIYFLARKDDQIYADTDYVPRGEMI